MARMRSPSALAGWRRRFVERIGRSRAATLALLAGVPREVVERPRTQDAWSIKDVLAHLAAWEEEGTRRLALIARGRPERMVWDETMGEADRFNARATIEVFEHAFYAGDEAAEEVGAILAWRPVPRRILDVGCNAGPHAL